MKSTLLLLTLSTVFGCTRVFAQEDDLRVLDRTLTALYTPVTVAPVSTSTLKLPKRKYDSPFFCNELIPWKTGYIINGLSIAPGRTFDYNYRYFYFNTANNKLEKITTPLTDSIESLIVWKDALYLSGKKNGACVIAKLDASGSSVISTSIKDANGQAVGWDTSWVKLGVYNDTLLAFDRNGIYVNRDEQWHSIFNRPFAAKFYDPKYRKRYPVIPTENIRAFNNTLYFLQEVTQQRTADVYSLNLVKDSCALEFFTRNNLTDNTKKEIMGYWVNEQGLYISILRLMQDAVVLTEKDGAVKTLVLNNRAMLKQGGQFVMGPSSVSSLGGDTLVLAGSDGLFLMVNNHITPLAYFSNTSQSIKEDGMALQFDFIPRSIARVKPNQFLLGGLWGGLYIVDVTKGAIQCVDDLKKTPPDRDLLGIVQQ